MISQELLYRPEGSFQSTKGEWRSVLFQKWPHVKSQSDTDHRTTNCVSWPLLQLCFRIHPCNRPHPKTASSVVAKHVFSNHRRRGPTGIRSRNRGEKRKVEGERPQCVFAPLGLKTAKTSKSKSTRAEFISRKGQTSCHTTWRLGKF